MKNASPHLKTLIIANPISGPGKAQRYLAAVSDIFETAGWEVDSVITEKAGEARAAASASGSDLIVSFGGDGTFNEVLNGVDLTNSTLAVLPAGTGNVLAQELRMPLHPLQAAVAIVHGDIALFDVGNANGRRFAFACGAGLNAHVIRLLHRNREGNITQWDYLPYFLRHVLRLPRWRIRVDIDGECQADNVNFVCISNTKSYGGPIELTPRADPTDGRLDVTSLRLESLCDLPVVAVAAMTHGLADCSHTRHGKGRRITLRAPREQVPYHVDGDFSGTLPLTVFIEPEPMSIIMAPQEHARQRILPI